jgi:protein TonB
MSRLEPRLGEQPRTGRPDEPQRSPPNRRAVFSGGAVALSLLAHATALSVLMLLPGRLASPAAEATANIAFMFEPAPAAPTVAAAPHEPTVPDTPPNEPAPAAPPAQAAIADSPSRAEDAIPVSPEPMPAPPKPATKPAAIRQAGRVRPPSHSSEPQGSPSPAVASAGSAANVSLVPPRPVAGMESNRAPAYPERAREHGEQGRVTIRVNVSADGTPLDVDVLATSGHPSLDSAALSAVRRWRFIPATQAGVPVQAMAEVPIRFQLEN